MSVAQISYFSGQRGNAIEYAERTRQEIPWHRLACNLLIESYDKQGRQEKADEVARQCRSYFPSDLLR